MIDFTVDLAKETGKVLMEKFGNLEKVEHKGVYDLLTEADVAADKLITKRIKEKFPEHNIVSEESKHEKTDSEYTWYIDPLDGTLNFAAGIPIFTTSLGLAKNGEMILGVVYNPYTGELFKAEKGKGAFRNGERIKVSKESKLRDVLVFAPINRSEDREKVRKEVQIIEKLVPKVRGVRMYNSGAYEMCSVARGQAGALIAHGSKPWDLAAGMLIVKEAGGKVTNFDGEKPGFDDMKYVWSNGVLHNKIMGLLR